MMDVVYALKRFDFLGKEFLTWLWFALENQPDTLRALDAQMSSLEIGNRLVLHNKTQQNTETVAIRGDAAGMEEGVLALRKGALVAEMNLVYRSGDESWQFTLRGDTLDPASLKVPQTGRLETKENIEGTAIEKYHLYRRVVDLIRALFSHFLELRLDSRWQSAVLPSFRTWINTKEG
jgi:hypothetical protein